MCGIAGFTFPLALPAGELVAERTALQRMVSALRHRGPDALTGLLDDGVALGHARLSIVDLVGGKQPMTDRDHGVTVVFNGEIFNYIELRQQLSEKYSFRTSSDTEVILAAYLAYGIDCVRHFNGQFAFALFDRRDGSVHLVRDRFGILPLFYARSHAQLCFASEIKAIVASGKWSPRLDVVGLWETLHQWAPASDRSIFEGVHQVPPGSYARFDRDGSFTVTQYWDLDFSDDLVDQSMSEREALDELDYLMTDAVRLRLRADVPVAAYLSGGIDSSLLCALAQEQLDGSLQTFSIGFAQERYDERGFQHAVADSLGTEHHSDLVDDRTIGELLPHVVDHAEAVLLRSAPAPMMRLSGLVHRHGTKVVLTGEGADEMFGGYDLFKEAQIRQFWARQPGSMWRPAILRRLYPYLFQSPRAVNLLREFYGIGLDRPGALDFSHQIRWTNSGRISRFLSEQVLAQIGEADHAAGLLASLNPSVESWRPLARAQYLEVRTLLSQYLLSSQGDRMLMAHSVEGRFPFLDHRIAEFSGRLPDRYKLVGLREKYLLKKYAVGRVPASVVERHKFPYRAPIAEALTGDSAPEWARQLLTREAVDGVGVFDGAKVERLVTKLGRGGATPSEADNMALMAVATSQLLISRMAEPAIREYAPDVRVETYVAP